MYILSIFFIPPTSVVLGILAALVEDEIQDNVPKYVRGNWHLWSPMVSRGVPWSPVVPHGLPWSPVFAASFQYFSKYQFLSFEFRISLATTNSMI